METEVQKINRRGLFALFGGAAAATQLPAPVAAKPKLPISAFRGIADLRPRQSSDYAAPRIMGARDVYVSEFGTLSLVKPPPEQP
jgi:hypothetical protein